MELERAQPLEESLLWRWQEAFYRDAGVRAWASGTVPWRVTSTPLIARAFADVLCGYREDAVRQGHAAEADPLCVVDLGAGAGRLAFLLCRELEARGVPLRYVMTDVAPSNLAAWRAHPKLAPLMARGVLDVALAPADAPSLALQLSQETWRPGELPGPLAALATYLFDTLPTAAWRKRGAALERGLVTLTAPAGTSDLADVSWELQFQPAPADAFVRGYAAGLDDGPFLVPVGALGCLTALRRLGGGRALTLMVDKGPRTRAQLARAPFPGLARHGSVSASVNFHALRAWAGFRQWLEPRNPVVDLGTYALVDGATAAGTLRTRAAFDEALGASPLLQALARVDAVATQEAPSAHQLLDALAATAFSPDALMRLSGPLRAVAPMVSQELLAVLVDSLDAAWANHFEIGEETDLAFEVATVLHRAGQLSHAARFYQASVAGRGPHPTTCFNLALCHLDLDEKDAARSQLERTVALAPQHERARALLGALGR